MKNILLILKFFLLLVGINTSLLAVPTISDDTASTTNNSSVFIDILQNDENDPSTIKTIHILSSPILGDIVSIHANTGEIEYRSRGASGVDNFLYKLEDYNNDSSDTASVTITITNENTPEDCELIDINYFAPIGDTQGHLAYTQKEMVWECNTSRTYNGACLRWEEVEKQYALNDNYDVPIKTSDFSDTIGDLLARIAALNHFSAIFGGWRGICMHGLDINTDWLNDPFMWASLAVSAAGDYADQAKAAQDALDEAIANGADQATIDSLQAAADSAASNPIAQMGQFLGAGGDAASELAKYGICILETGLDLASAYADEGDIECDPIDEICPEDELTAPEVTTMSRGEYNDLVAEIQANPELRDNIEINELTDSNTDIVAFTVQVHKPSELLEPEALEEATKKVQEIQRAIKLAIATIKAVSCIAKANGGRLPGFLGTIQDKINNGTEAIKNGFRSFYDETLGGFINSAGHVWNDISNGWEIGTAEETAARTAQWDAFNNAQETGYDEDEDLDFDKDGNVIGTAEPSTGEVVRGAAVNAAQGVIQSGILNWASTACGPYAPICKIIGELLLRFITNIEEIDSCNSEDDARMKGTRHLYTYEHTQRVRDTLGTDFDLCHFIREYEYASNGFLKPLYAKDFCCYDTPMAKTLTEQIKAQLAKDWTHCSDVSLREFSLVSFQQCTDAQMNDLTNHPDGAKTAPLSEGGIPWNSTWSERNSSFQHYNQCMDLREFKKFLTAQIGSDAFVIDDVDIQKDFDDMQEQFNNR